MAGADRQALDAALKDVIEEGVREGVYYKNPLRDVLKHETSPFRGRQVMGAIHTGGNIGVMASSEDAVIVDAGQQGFANFFVDQKKVMARIRMTWEAMQDSMSSEGAFISARKSEQQYLIDDIARTDEYFLNTDGRGVLCLVDESPSGTTLDVDAPGGITNDNYGSRFCAVGQYVGAVNPATGQLRDSIRKITSIPAAGASLVMDAATYTGWANNDYIVRVANSGVTDVRNTSYENAWWGLMGLVDDGTYRTQYFGVDRTNLAAFSSYVTAGVGPISIDLIQRVSDVLNQKMGGNADLILCHHSTRRLVLQLTADDRRYTNGNLMKPDAGTVAFTQGDISFGGVPFRALRDFPLDVMMFLDTKQMELTEYVSEPGKWADESGSVLKDVGAGTSAKDAFEAWFRCRKQYFLGAPAKCARLDGITGQTIVVARPVGW